MIFNFPAVGKEYTYRKYRTLIIAAEQKIIAGNLTTALNMYDSAFAIMQPIGVDAYNYTVCAIEKNRMDLANSGCLLLCKIGVGEKYFQQSAFDKVRQQPYWELIRKKALIYKVQIEKSAGSYWKELDALYAQDQAIARARKEQNIASTDSIPTRWVTEVDAVTRGFLNLVKKYGFPDIHHVGQQLINDTTLQVGTSHIIIMLHAFQLGSWEIKDTLARLVQEFYRKGLISPVELKFLMNDGGYWPMPLGEQMSIMVHNCRVYKRRMNGAFYSRVDRFRAYWWLESLDQFFAKTIFRIRNPEKKYQFNAYAHKISIIPSPIEKELLNESEVVGEAIPNCQE